MIRPSKIAHIVTAATLVVSFFAFDNITLAEAVIPSSADVSIVVGSDRLTNSNFLYTVTAQNNTGESRSNVFVFVPIPSGLEYVENTATDGGILDNDGQRLECPPGDDARV